MAQLTLVVGWGEVGVDAGRAAGDVAAGAVGVREPPAERGAFLAQAESATEITIRITAQRLTDMATTSLEPAAWGSALLDAVGQRPEQLDGVGRRPVLGGVEDRGCFVVVAGDDQLRFPDPLEMLGAPEMPNDR
jgi:hypothetical protein